MHIFLGHFGRTHDGVVIAMEFDAETGDRFAGLGNAVDHFFRPAFFNADHHHGGDVGVGARADDGAEMQVQVGAKLQPAIGMRDRNRALDVVGHGFSGGIGQIVNRQNQDVVADTNAAVLAAIAHECGFAVDHLFLRFGSESGSGSCRADSPFYQPFFTNAWF